MLTGEPQDYDPVKHRAAQEFQRKLYADLEVAQRSNRRWDADLVAETKVGDVFTIYGTYIVNPDPARDRLFELLNMDLTGDATE